MLAIGDRVVTKVDPRHRGLVVARLSRNFGGIAGRAMVRVRWESGAVEDIDAADLRRVK